MRKSYRLLLATLWFPLMALVPLGPSALGGTLTVYGNWPTDQIQVLADGFNAIHPDVEVKIFRAPIEELFTVLSMEMMGGSPRADIVFIGDPGRAEQFKREGHLLKYQPPQEIMAGFDSTFVDPDGYWLPVSIVPVLIQYNLNQISKEDAPKSWADILDPKYRGKIVYADPKMTGTVHNVIYFLTEMLADRGAPYGWEYYKRLAEQRPMIVGGHRQIRELVTTGERPLAGEQSLDHIAQAIQSNEPVWLAWPEEGTPAYCEVVAGIAKSKNMDEVKKFLDWIATREVNMELISRRLGRLSARDDLGPGFATPDGKTMKDINFVSIGEGLTPAKRAEQANIFTDLIGKFK